MLASIADTTAAFSKVILPSCNLYVLAKLVTFTY